MFLKINFKQVKGKVIVPLKIKANTKSKSTSCQKPLREIKDF